MIDDYDTIKSKPCIKLVYYIVVLFAYQQPAHLGKVFCQLFEFRT